MNPDAHLTYALAMAMAYSSKVVERHPKQAEIVAEVATILGAARETESLIERGGEVHDDDLVIMYQAAIITSTVEAWTPFAVPHLEQARQILEWAAAQTHPDRPPLFVDPTANEGTRLAKGLAAAVGNLARAAGALSAVLLDVEGSRFKKSFDVGQLFHISQATGVLMKAITPLRIPDLSDRKL